MNDTGYWISVVMAVIENSTTPDDSESFYRVEKALEGFARIVSRNAVDEYIQDRINNG